ncbi:MAG: aminotransferase class III-fold pyridoxal phosphate-dependent enzyme, partial [Clostridiales bacterium]|nr:aminotransferase class III-fold pyridoxal phosphate-dependent enzyme [Clostridiales bacterium]
MNIKETDNQYISHTYGRFNVVLTRGKGSILSDENGKEYIDFGSGIGVNSFGAADEIWKKAVKDQLDKLQHASNLYYTEPCAELAKLLCEKTGMKKVFFSNSGAEANEGAIKFARKYSFDKYGEGRSTIITLLNSFHGRTITTLSASGQDALHTNFAPFTDGFKYCHANDIDALKEAVTDDVCAIMFECIQGEGGVLNLDYDFIKAIETICAKNDILTIVDEVQTGNGRTGKYFAYMNYGINPDIVTTAKGLAGGLPIGAVLFGAKTENTPTVCTHGSTFGGNPISAAGAISIVKRIDEKLLNEVFEKGEYIRGFLKSINGVKSVSGMG